MNRFRIILLLLLPAFSPPGLFAQKAWTLDQCINFAWDNNFSVHNQELGVRIRKTDYKQSMNDLYPSLGFQTSYNQYFGRSRGIRRFLDGFIEKRERFFRFIFG